jgi:hypothetical protein
MRLVAIIKLPVVELRQVAQNGFYSLIGHPEQKSANIEE